MSSSSIWAVSIKPYPLRETYSVLMSAKWSRWVHLLNEKWTISCLFVMLVILWHRMAGCQEMSLYSFTFNALHSSNSIPFLYFCEYRMYVVDMDKKTLEFVTYCIAKLSAQLNLPQKEVYRRLKSSGILYGYIVPSYDVLHTFSSRYLI